MATLVLTAVGTLVGGPIGGAIGAIIGGQVDAEIFGPAGREGPRLKELAVTTSSYGTPIPRHFGTMRAAGSIVWATDLVESSETSGGKGQPSVTTYSYSSSFAVALSSRPVADIGRIWADGNLLRGAAGDLKTSGTLRFYHGYGDQQPDPLIAAAEGTACPAFRGLAYAVFEDLQLADFGNRLPSLTFELIAENGDVTLLDIVGGTARNVSVDRALPALTGFSDEGGAIGNTLATVSSLYPLASDASAGALRVFSPDAAVGSLPVLPAAVIDPAQESFGASFGAFSNRKTRADRLPAGVRYYDTGRDFQAGTQLAGGRANSGQTRLIEFPGALAASDARALAEMARKRARAMQDQLNYRIAELDPALSPGTIVTVPGKGGAWRIENWEWRDFGLELSLTRLPPSSTPYISTDAGRALAPIDALATPTLLSAFELPWDGMGSSDTRQIFAAPSSVSAGWTGAILYAQSNGALETLGGSGNKRSITGLTTAPLAGMQSAVVQREAALTVQLDSPDFALSSQTIESLALGANRALVGDEIIQFARALFLGGSTWELRGLLRGRGGTEDRAASEIPARTRFVLLNADNVRVDEEIVGSATSLAAIGLADSEAVLAPIAGLGATRGPLTPVHPRTVMHANGDIELCWTRRARGAWRWEGTVEPPLVEQSELYELGFGNVSTPFATWSSSVPDFTLAAADAAQLVADHGSNAIWVRQIGTHARSLPLLLTTLT